MKHNIDNNLGRDYNFVSNDILYEIDTITHCPYNAVSLFQCYSKLDFSNATSTWSTSDNFSSENVIILAVLSMGQISSQAFAV